MNRRVILVLFCALYVRISLETEECGGPLQPEVVWYSNSGTEHTEVYNASNLLTLADEDICCTIDGKRAGNYWVANAQTTTNEGFIMKIHSCKRWIAGFSIQNKGSGDDPGYSTRKFGVSGSQNEDGPWTLLVEEELEDTMVTGEKEAQLHTFLFDDGAKEIKFLKFDVISYWGTFGAGLQYFFPKLAEGDFGEWTNWSSCCNGETKRRKMVEVEGKIKNKTETLTCNRDECPVNCVLSDWSDGTPFINKSRRILTHAENGGERCDDGLFEMKPYVCDDNTLLIGIAGLLLLLLVLETIGITCFICKVKSSARRAIKRDVNPLYGVDYEDQDDKNRQSNSVDNYDYMGN